MTPFSASAFPELPPPPAAIVHLARSNATVPDAVETGLIRSYIEELDLQMASLDEVLASLRLRKEQLRETRKTYEACFAPIRRLPPELLGLIFSAVVQGTFLILEMGNAPWMLTRVCRHWSAVALSNPTLWTRLYLPLHRVGENGAIPLTRLQIERSQNMPLTLKIRDDDDWQRASHPVLDVVLSASAQWGIVDVYMRPLLLEQISKARRFDSLTTFLITIDLSVDDRFDTVSKYDDAFWNVFSVAPKLRHLQALSWNTESTYVSPPFRLPWHQLTRLSTSTTSNTEALTVLHKLSSIVECTLAFATAGILQQNHTIVCLPHLRSLALQIEDEPIIYQKRTSVLDFLETPSLQSLAVYQTADVEAVLGLVTRSNCASSLTLLHLYSNSIDHDMALHLIEKMPSLTSLELGDFDGAVQVLPTLSLTAVFIQAFSERWLKQKSVGESRLLRLLIADHAFEYLEDEQLTSLFTSLEKEGLFITLSSSARVPSIIMDNFRY